MGLCYYVDLCFTLRLGIVTRARVTVQEPPGRGTTLGAERVHLDFPGDAVTAPNDLYLLWFADDSHRVRP